MAPDQDDEAPENLVVYEASPGRAPAGARDGSDELLRAEDRFTPKERAQPTRRWLAQGPKSRPNRVPLYGQRVAEPIAASASARTPPALGARTQDAAEKSVDEALKAWAYFVGAIRRPGGMVQGPNDLFGSDALKLLTRSFDFAEQNVNATFEFTQRLMRARDLEEAFKLQSDFVRSQFAAVQAQAKEYSSLAQPHESGADEKSAEGVGVDQPGTQGISGGKRA